MAIKSREQALKILCIQQDVFGACQNEDEKIALIKKCHRKLALKYHPDRNKDINANDKFMLIQEAYEYLLKPMEKEAAEQDFMQYFPSVRVPFELSSIDLRLELQIKEEFDDLLLRFSRLTTEEQKQTFARNHQNFVSIARKVEEYANDLSELRYTQFVDLYEGFFNKISYFWRTNMLTLFGEELLDDLVYREAIALGNWYPVLAYRKLFNPIKLCAAVILTLIAPLKATYIQMQVMLSHHITYLSGMWDKEDITLDDAGDMLFSMFIVALITFGPLAMLFYTYTAYAFMALCCIPLLNSLCFSLACPTNQLIRPLLSFFELHDSVGYYMPLILPLLATGLVIGITYLIPMITASIIPMVVLTISYACEFYIFYALARLIYASFQVSILMGLLSLISVVASIAVSSLFAPTAFAALTALQVMLLNVSSAVLFYGLLCIVDQGSEFVNGILLKLAMPTQLMSDEFKNTINKVIKSTAYSEEFFNTQKDAKPVAHHERSFWRQTQSFFGFYPTENKQEKCADNETVTLMVSHL